MDDMANMPDWQLKAIVAVTTGEWRHSATAEELQRAKEARKELQKRKHLNTDNHQS